MAKETKKNISQNKVNKKKKKFSTSDFVAMGVFGLIILIVLGSVGYYYGYHRPTTNRIVSQKAEEFTKLFYDIDYENEDYSFEPLYEYLNYDRQVVLSRNEANMKNSRRLQRMKVTVHEVESIVVESGWDTARVRVNMYYTEVTISTEDPKPVWGIMYYDFENLDGEWLIKSYAPGTLNETNLLNEERQ